MPRALQRLSAIAVKRTTRPGYHADGGGLYLQVSKSRTKSWVFRYTRHGRTRELGLGGLLTTPLQEARRKAEAMRLALGTGTEPVALRDLARQQVAARMSFADCATAYIAAHRDGWKNAKHADQWAATLDTYANPVFGRVDVSLVDTDHVLRALEPIWRDKTETASRLRGRIERVLAWATTRKLRSGENPARWRGHLDTLLPRPNAVRAVDHHAALSYSQMPPFMARLRAESGVAARALEFLILTATRTSEVTGARWEEIDLQAAIWTIPGERMKAGKEHRVPLSRVAISLLSETPPEKRDGHLFQGAKAGKPLSNMAMMAVLRRMGFAGLTVHGFRSTFRDWAAEETAFPRELAEKALAHAIRSETEAAYQRGDLLKRRAEMMQEWADMMAISMG